MKTKIMLALIAACFAINALAESMTASLQSGDKLSVFYGTTAFKEAYAAAQDGDVITLSLGHFTDLGEAVSKSIAIYGTYAFSETNNTAVNNLAITAANVKIEGINIGQLDPSESTNLIIRSCYLSTLSASKIYNTILVEQCTIKEFTNTTYAYDFSFINCVIKTINDRSSITNIGHMRNCLVYDNKETFHAIYQNCILGYYQGDVRTYFTGPSEYYNNVFFDKNEYGYSYNFGFSNGTVNSDNQTFSQYIMFGGYGYTFPDIPTNVPTGSDGTSVGPNGGIGFNKYPTIPRIVRSEISNSADDNGNIHVVIEATTQRQ